MQDKSIPFEGTTVVYHITPAENTRSILLNGLDPTYAKGKMQAVWYVSKYNIEWAAIHTSERHHVLPDDLVICAVLVERASLHKFFKPGFYYTFSLYDVESVTPLMFFLHNEMRRGYE